MSVEIIGGHSATVAFKDLSQAQANFTGDGNPANWNIGPASFDTWRSALIGKKLTIMFHINGFTIAGTPANLSFQLPTGIVSRNKLIVPIFFITGGFPGVYNQTCFASVDANSGFLDFRPNNQVAWANQVNVGFAGEITFEIK